MNELNLKLQGRGHNISDLVDNISAFQRKLQLFDSDLTSRKLLHFTTLRTAIGESLRDVNLSVMVDFIQLLIINFKHRFEDFKIDKQILVLLKDPFNENIEGGVTHSAASSFNFVDEASL